MSDPEDRHQNIVDEVMEYITQHNLRVEREGHPLVDFATCDEALKAIWPELYETDDRAALLVAVHIYLEIADRWGFEPIPEGLKEFRRPDNNH